MSLPGKIVALCSFLLFFCWLLVAQDAEKVSCPETVQVADPQLAKPVEGWNVSVAATPHRLSRVIFYDGPVEQQASLVPDRETQTKKVRTAVWLLKPNPERPYWLACHYSGTSLSLSRALPSGLKRCAVDYSSSQQIDGMPAVKSISCK